MLLHKNVRKKGLTRSTEIAILNANYIKERLSEYFDILYTGSNGRVAHEMIIDFKGHIKNMI